MTNWNYLVELLYVFYFTWQSFFFSLKIEWRFTLAFTENGIYEWNCEGGTLKGKIFFLAKLQ